MNQQGEARSRTERLPWIMPPRVLPLWLAGVEWGWWRIFQSEAVASLLPSSAAPSPALTAGVALAGKLLGHASEAAFYLLWWRACGARLPFKRFLVIVISASLADQIAYAISTTSPHGAIPAWRIWVAGLHLAGGSILASSPAFIVAFGSASLLTAARIGITAAAQSRATARSFAQALAWTTGVWLLSRLALWWGIDLLRGMSPVGGR